MAEREGFEPSVRYQRTHTFQACSLSHSDTSPGPQRLGETFRVCNRPAMTSNTPAVSPPPAMRRGNTVATGRSCERLLRGAPRIPGHRNEPGRAGARGRAPIEMRPAPDRAESWYPRRRSRGRRSPPRFVRSMAARIGPLASPGREPRQARKGAAAAADASAGVRLVRVASTPLAAPNVEFRYRGESPEVCRVRFNRSRV